MSEQIEMNAATCLKKLGYIGVLAFATVDENNDPQIRNISAIHYESDAMYFFTARGKDFCKQLEANNKVQVLGYSMYKEMIRLSGRAIAVEQDEQKKWMDKIFEEQPYLENVYPDDTREIGIIFAIKDAEIEYFNLGVKPIFRESYTLGNGKISSKGFVISDSCIGCGTCAKACPQRCIEEGTPFHIQPQHCLHCGNCFEHCPADAIQRL